MKFKVVVAPVVAVVPLLWVARPLAETVTVYEPMGTQLELYPPLEFVVVFTVVVITPPVMVTAAPEIGVPPELVMVPAIFPPVASAKFKVEVAPETTVTEWITLKYPVCDAVRL